jgi:hypothetical protein
MAGASAGLAKADYEGFRNVEEANREDQAMMTRATRETKPVIEYIRVSTQQQGKSGLGLEAQREAISRFAEAEGFRRSRAAPAVCEHEDQPKRQPTNVRWWPPVTSTMAGLRRPRVPAASRPSGSQFPGDQDQVV